MIPGVCLTDRINVPLDGPVSLQLSLELSKEAESQKAGCWAGSQLWETVKEGISLYVPPFRESSVLNFGLKGGTFLQFSAMAEVVSYLSPSFLAKKYSIWCAFIPVSPSPPLAATSGQTDCLNPNSTDVSVPGTCSLYNVEFLGIRPLHNTLQESPAKHPSVWCTCSAESVSALEDVALRNSR